MTNIIALCGKKGSGKNTLCNFLHGYQLKSLGMINEFYLDGNNLIVNMNVQDENGEESKQDVLLDITRTDLNFGEWAAYNMWPFIKHYAFASSLKEIAEKMFNIPRECLYGTDDQKNRVMPHLLWENMPGVITREKAWEIFNTFNSWNYHNLTQEEIHILNEKIKIQYSPQNFNPNNPLWCVFPDKGILVHNPGPMTAREFMQFFGTEIMRKMYEPIWVERTIKDIQTEESQLAVISDCRFKNEAVALKQAGAKLVYLDRSISNSDNHLSENGFGDFSDFDLVINNKNMTLKETCQALLDGIKSWDWIEKPKEKSGIQKIKAEK